MTSLDVTSHALWFVVPAGSSHVPRALGSALRAGRNSQSGTARHCAGCLGSSWPQFLLPTGPRAISVGLTLIWDCAKDNELLSGHFSRRWHREVVQPC